METLTIIHLSDLHISTERKPEASYFRKLSSFIHREYPGCPVLVTGDITDSATKPQMHLARRLLGELAKTNFVLAVPGNHDFCATGAFHRWKAPMHWTEILGTPLGPRVMPRHWMSVEDEPFGIEGVGVFEHGFCTFIGLDSGDPFNKERLARGIVTSTQTEALREILIKHRERVRVVFLHHHPFTDDIFLGLNGARRLMNALEGNCELLLFGHGHRIGLWRGRNQIPLIVASHKSTGLVIGSRLLIGVIQVKRDGVGIPAFSHCLKLV